ncbi:integrase arm-type DNA-binding domain-containing protein, partial [Limnobacter sp. CACIAM 66H1]|uniref:tyrosine-type recombinase/integrase n=1 Tax=Limnobacter sp. CACIAM 66H1 TaxID=1813033 RepID=UPI000AD26FFE
MPRSKINILNAKSKELTGAAEPGYYSDGGGLFLQVSNQGTKSWVFRFKSPVTLKAREMGLGSINTVSLAMARTKALDARIQVSNGLDPLIEKQNAEHQRLLVTARKAATFAICARECIQTHEASWKNAKHRAQWESTLETYAFPIIGNKPVDEIDEQMVLRVLAPIWHTKAETASRLRGRIEKVLDYATAKKHRSGENPARWKGNLKELLGKQSRDTNNQPALPYSRVAEFLHDLRTHEGITAKAIEFVILTACRSGEVRLATWDEFNLAEKKWTIPANRMKAGKEHTVPLSEQAIQLLQTMPRMEGSEFVFFAPRGGALSDMALTAMVRRMHATQVEAGQTGYVDPAQKDSENNPRTITVHGFRSSFRDWAGDTTSYPREVIEKSLAHGIKDKTEEAYARGELLRKRIKLMQAW